MEHDDKSRVRNKTPIPAKQKKKSNTKKQLIQPQIKFKNSINDLNK